MSHGPGACTIVQYEQYHFPFRSRPLMTAWRLYVTRTMEVELDQLRCSPNRRQASARRPASN